MSYYQKPRNGPRVAFKGFVSRCTRAEFESRKKKEKCSNGHTWRLLTTCRRSSIRLTWSNLVNFPDRGNVLGAFSAMRWSETVDGKRRLPRLGRSGVTSQNGEAASRVARKLTTSRQTPVSNSRIFRVCLHRKCLRSGHIRCGYGHPPFGYTRFIGHVE